MKLPGTLQTRMDNLNNAIQKIEGLSSSYHIGAAYFLKDGRPVECTTDAYSNLWSLRIEPLLKEYLRGMPEAEKHLINLTNVYNNEETIEATPE